MNGLSSGFLLVYTSNILLLQWAEVTLPIHTRYKDADGPLRYLLNSFVAGVGICNIVGGLYSDLMWRQTPQEADARAKAASIAEECFQQQLQRVRVVWRFDMLNLVY